MSQTIRVPNGFATLVDVDFNCPACTCPHEESDYYEQLAKSKTGLIYKKCKGCKNKLGITSDIKGDVVVWLKDEEEK